MPHDLIANRYRVLRMLGEGTMGVVWAVEDTTTGQQVALKVISQAYGASPISILQLKQEFRLMTQLRHPNCCAVYDYGVLEDGQPYFTMEIVTGHGIDELVPMAPERFVQVLTQLLLALGYIHQLGFVHRDIKAENVRVRPDGSLKLMDYGLMEYARRTGAAINGTVAYLAPEVLTRGSVDPRGDLYAVGVLAYEMLTGRQPFVSEAPLEVVRAHVHEPPVPPGRLCPGLDPLHERIVLKLLAKDPLDRYASAYHVLEDLGVEVPAGIGGSLLASPLLGREAELAALGAALTALTQRALGAAMLLWGPSGIGKSRLLEEFRYGVQLEHLPVAVGESHEHGNAPYDPFVTLLKGLLPALRAHAPDALDRHGPVLVQLLPELGYEPAPALDAPTKDKLRLQSTIAELLVDLAGRKPIVLVLEDWQWADVLSIELFEYLRRNTLSSPIVYLLTARSPLDGQLEGVERLAISPLDREGVARMLAAMLGLPEVPAEFVDRVAALSKGLPFFVEKLLEHLVENMTLVNTRGHWNTDVELPLNRLPNNLKGLLMWRLTCLAESAQAIAQIGAVAGHTFDLDLLQRVARVPEEAFFAAIESLRAQQLWVPVGDGAYQFAQDQIQELVVANLEPAEKRRLHGAIAAALEERYAGATVAEMPIEEVTAIASHHLEAGAAAKTVVFALEAGKRSAALFANAEAERFLGAGLALVPAGDEQHRLEFLRTLGDVWRVTGKTDAAKGAYEEAVALAEALEEPFWLGRMLTHLARCHQVMGAFPEALGHCERALAVCKAQDDALGAAKSHVQAGRIHYFMGQVASALESAERGLALAREAGHRGLMGESLAMLGYFYVASGALNVQEGISNLDRAVAIANELGDKIALNTSYNFLGTAQNMLGRFRDAWDSFAHNRAISYAIGAQDELIFALLNLAITAYELGDLAEMGRMAEEARAIAERLNSRFPLGMAITLGAVADALSGKLAGVRERLDGALALARELKHKYMESQVRLYQIEVLLLLGCLEEAGAASEALAALIAETGDHEPESRLATLRAEILARTGAYAEADAAVDAALRAANASFSQGIQVRAQYVKAWLAWARGEAELARRLLEGTLVLAVRLEAQYQQTRLWSLTGAIAIATERGHPMAHFEEAEAVAEAIGAPLYLALARFGRAAADPDAPEALSLAASARGLLEAMLAPLDAEARRRFTSLHEHAWIWRGEYRQPMLSAAEPSAGGGAALRLGLHPDVWNRL